MIASIALTSFVAAKRNEADDVREYFDAIFKGIAGPREAGDSAEQEIREFPADSALCAACQGRLYRVLHSSKHPLLRWTDRPVLRLVKARARCATCNIRTIRK